MRIYINNIWIYIVNMSIVQLAFCVLIGVVSLLLYKPKRRMSYWKSRGICHDKPSFLICNMKGFMHTRHCDDIFKEAYEKDKGSYSLSYKALEEMTHLHQVFMGKSNYCCQISSKLSPN